MNPTIALLGNPNTGKTTLFNALTGLSHRVGNYPGVTVESKIGMMGATTLIDLPGTYSLAPRSPDEMVAVDVILGRQAAHARPDSLLCIVDASNLERNLYLTTQAMEAGLPVVVALNMGDVARGLGMSVDAPALAQRLGVPVVPIQANTGAGLDALRAALSAAGQAAPSGPDFPDCFEAEVARLREAAGGTFPDFLLRRALLDVGGYTEATLQGLAPHLAQARARLAEAGCPVPAIEARTRYAWIRQALAGSVKRPDVRPPTWTDALDSVLTHRAWGTLAFLSMMLALFLAIFWAAKPFMKLIDSGREALAGLARWWLPPGPATSLFTEGIIGGVGAVVVFLPQILILFALLAILEDCGYMARAAFVMDKVMARAGLSGKSFIPMLSSLACAVPGIMATRVIEDRRDRLVTILVAPLMSCSARLPVYLLLVGAFLTVGYSWWVPGLALFAMYMVGIVAAPLVALALKGTLLPGAAPVFVMEMPAYKWPTLWGVLRRVWDAAWAFLARAGTVILASMVVVWVLLNFPARDYPQRIAALEDSVKQQREQAEPLEEKLKPLLRQQRRSPTAARQAEIQALKDELAPLAAKIEPADERINELQAEWKRGSMLGRIGRALEPAVRPLGWDWRIGVAALASFPAREVFVSTLGILYQQGKTDTEEILAAEGEEIAATGLGKALKEARHDGTGRPVYTVPVALSLMVFFALCCQCASTLVVIRRETRSWTWPLFTFAYMTLLAYVAALVVYQVGTLIGGGA